MPARFDLVVFDWDGSLFDSTRAISRSIQLACADLGLPVPSDQRASYVIGLGLRDALEYAVPDLTPAQLPAMLERYRHHYQRQDRDIDLFPGARELLAALRARGHRLGVATGKSRAGLDRALAQAGLAHVFEATRCADETRPKPDPAMLRELGLRLAVPAGRTVMIGDTTHDLRMARDAGVAGLAVTYGAHPHADLLAEAPLACLASVAELADWLVTHA